VQTLTPLCLLRITFVLGISLGSAAALFAATPTPGFTIAATIVSVPGQGTSTSQLTVSSVDGFAGTVGVSCFAPNVANITEPVIPSCTEPIVNVVVPANGSTTGTMIFFPPWEINIYDPASLPVRRKPSHSEPMLAGILIGSAMLGWRIRRALNRGTALGVAVIFSSSLAALAGCMGQGGLAMTAGTYAYAISGTSDGMTETTSVLVTVQCNSCP
jgi:hypothetical protein